MNTKRVSVVTTLVFVVSIPLTAQSQDRYPVRQLSNEMHQEGFPTWSPDGKTIVFENVQPDHVGLFKVSPEGGEPVRFTSFIAEHPKWSPDGAYLVFDAEFGDSIKIMSSHGGRPVRLVPPSIPVNKGGNPVWSPDSSRIAFKSGSVVWVLEIETGHLTKVFEAPGKLTIPSCWSRDGKRILLWLKDRQTKESAIVSVTPGGKVKELFAPVEGKVYRYLDESPDGSLVVFAWCEGRSCDLWAAPSGGGKAVQLTMHPSYDDTPSWSPDGTRIAFTSARTGKMDIYIMDLDLGDLRNEMEKISD
jgi:TolB protein